jgi:hypothetical protein
MIGLPTHYRFKVYNKTGQTIASGGNANVYSKRVKFDSSGALTFEGSEAIVLVNTGSSISDSAYFAGTTQDNTTDKYIGGHFTFKVTAPASSSGDVTLFFERSTDGGTTWDDDGLGEPVATINFTTSGTKKVTFSL